MRIAWDVIAAYILTSREKNVMNSDIVEVTMMIAYVVILRWYTVQFSSLDLHMPFATELAYEMQNLSENFMLEESELG